MDIYMFLSNDWNDLWATQQKVAVQVSKDHRLIVFETLGFSRRNLAAFDFERLRHRLRRFASGGTVVNPNLKVYSPPSIPYFQNGLLGKANLWLLEAMLRRVEKSEKVSNPLLWTFLPSERLLNLTPRLPVSGLIYECLDDFSKFTGAPANFEAIENELVKRANIVFASSVKQVELKKEINPATYLVHNACDFDHFSQAVQETTILAEEIQTLPKPIIGFVGSYDFWVDTELIEAVARAHPEWTILLIGPYNYVDPKKMPKGKNILPLGTRPYQQLPAYLKGIDVGLLPFRKITYMETADPIIMYDWLAAGRPVVATDFPAAREMERRVVPIGKDVKEFIGLIEQSLEEEKDLNKRAAGIQARHAAVKDHTWEHRVRCQLSLIQKHLPA